MIADSVIHGVRVSRVRREQYQKRVLLLAGNAHPQSIKNGMFHTAESGIADLWRDLRGAKLFSGDDSMLGVPARPGDWCPRYYKASLPRPIKPSEPSRRTQQRGGAKRAWTLFDAKASRGFPTL